MNLHCCVIQTSKFAERVGAGASHVQRALQDPNQQKLAKRTAWGSTCSAARMGRWELCHRAVMQWQSAKLQARLQATSKTHVTQSAASAYTT